MKQVTMVAAWVFLTACGGAGGGSGGGTGGTGGAGGAGGSGGSGGGDSGKFKGSIAVTQLELAGGFLYAASANFSLDGFPAQATSCVSRMVGGCTVVDCTAPDAGVPDAGTVDSGIPDAGAKDAGGIDAGPPADAGPVADAGDPTFAGSIRVQIGMSTVALTRGPSRSYLGSAMAGVPWFLGDETVNVFVGGADGGVPAFNATFKAPSKVSITGPALDGGAVDVTRGAPVTVTWSAASRGTITAVLTGGVVGTNSTQVSCTAAASMGALSISGAATQVLPIGSGTLHLQNNSAPSTTTAGVWTVESSASSVTATRTTRIQ